MPDPRYPYWIEEQSSTYRGPTMSRIFFLLALVALVLIAALSAGPTATAQGGERKAPTLCQEHRGDPGWASVCKPARRR
jgi:hypothetical protein